MLPREHWSRIPKSLLESRWVEDASGEKKPEIIVFDALVAFHEGEENDSGHMRKILRLRLRTLAKKYGLTIIMVHHVSKPSSQPIRGLWGMQN